MVDYLTVEQRFDVARKKFIRISRNANNGISWEHCSKHRSFSQRDNVEVDNKPIGNYVGKRLNKHLRGHKDIDYFEWNWERELVNSLSDAHCFV